MSNNSKRNPFVPAGGGAWKKLDNPVKHTPQLFSTDSDKKRVLGQLTELFGSVIDQNVIETIASSCGWNVQLSIDALMEVSSNIHSHSTKKAETLNLISQPREMKPRQLPSSAPALQAIKVAYEGYDDSSDDADVIIEDEEEVQIVQNISPRFALPASNLPRTEPVIKSVPKETKRGPVKCAQSLQIDVITESINRGIKIMVLMRGVPGSGKSFLARKLISDSLLDAQPEHFVFSTDDFFSQSGHYIFSPQKLPEAHEWNRRRVAAALHKGTSPIIIDNTNTEVWEMKPYVFPAVHYGYAIEILEPSTPWSRKESELCRRNTHGVPRQNIRNMLERYEKTSVADMMVSFECSYAYGNTPPQPCSNKPKMKSARKTQRENGARRKPAGEPQESPSRAVVGKHVKSGEQQVNKVLPCLAAPLPQRAAKQENPNVVSVAALERDIKAMALQKEVTKPSESHADRSAGNTSDIELANVRHVDAESGLKELPKPSLGHEDLLAKMKCELKASLRSGRPREETGDVVREMFKEDVLVRLGQQEKQWAGFSLEDRLEAMDREVERLMDEMWEHFVQLNGLESDGSRGKDEAEIEIQLGRGDVETVGMSQHDDRILAAEVISSADIKTELEEEVGNDQDCKLPNANECDVVDIKLEQRKTSPSAEDQRVTETLTANEGSEVSEEVAADLIENLIISVNSALASPDVRDDSSDPKDMTEVPKPKDATEQLIELDDIPYVPSITEDVSLSADYSLVDPLLSDINSHLTESKNVEGDVNNADSEPLVCPSFTPAKENASHNAMTGVRDVTVPKVLTSVPETPAPKQSGLFSWLFPRKAPAVPVSSVPAKADFVLGFSDPSYTVFDQGVNCNPESQESCSDRDGSLVEVCDSKLLEVSDTTVPISPGELLSKVFEDFAGPTNQEGIQDADDEGLSLLQDATEMNNKPEECATEPAADGQMESADKKSEGRNTDSNILAGFEEEERAIDILLSKLSPDKLDKTDHPAEILPPSLIPDSEEKSIDLGVTNQFEIVPSNSMLRTDEKSAEFDQISQSFQILPSIVALETEDKSDKLVQMDTIPDVINFTNPWAEVELKPKAVTTPLSSLGLHPRKPKATRNSATNTTHADFSAAEGSTGLSLETMVISARGRSINDDGPGVTGTEEERTRPAIFSLDKGCMTSPVESEPRQHDFDLLVNMFPRIGADDLREVFDKCRHEINWAVELLLESGYDFEPRDDVDTGFDVAQGLESTHHLLEELNTRDLGMIQEASVKQESLPHQEPSSLPSEPLKSEPSTSSPVSKKSPKKPSQLTLALQRQVESSVRIGESFYSEHTLKLRRQRHGESEQLDTEPSALDSDTEPMENEDEVVVPLTLDTEFLRQLQRLFGQLPFQYPEGVPPVVQVPVALARQIHGYLIDSQQQQLDKQEEYFQNMIKDEEFARRLQEEEMPAPDLREIMDMELALELYRASQRDPNPAQDDLATRLSRQKLLQQFPNVNRDVLAEVFAAHAYSFSETVAVIEASVKADGEPVKNVLSPEALLALEKQLIKQAQEESKKQSESSSSARGSGWSAEGARETPAMDSARNFREEALRLVQLRSECFRKASDAHRNGQTAVASYYAQVGHLYKEHIEEANSRAAAALLAANAEDRQSTTLDLHFLYVAEALEALDIFLDHHVASLASAGFNDSRPLFIITGAGQHSAGGRARIKPAVERRLAQRKAKFVQINPGMLKVTATKNMALSSTL